MRALHLITARGGSKGVPGKNLRKICGISLVGFKAISAAKSQHCSRLIISTDSPAIQAEARHCGVEVPFTRREELATDEASSLEVIWDTMQYIEHETTERYDALMVLEPSSPFATFHDLDNAVELMERTKANVVVGVRPVEVHSIFQGPLDERSRIGSIVIKLTQTSLRRQDLPREYTMNGSFYLVRWDFFTRHRKIYVDPETTYGYVMDRAYSIEIDEPIDLAWAEFLVARGDIDLSHWRAPTPRFKEASVAR